VATSASANHSPALKRLLRGLKLRVWIAEVLRPSELQITLCWAGAVGFTGALVSMVFRRLTEAVHWLATQHTGSYSLTFAQLPSWRRLLTPMLGGLVAGLVLYAGARFRRSKYTTDYMEAVVVGEGVISVRSSLIKTLSALFSIASGASIGREGPLVQLASMCASLVGWWQQWSRPRRRLLVACGAAAGIASAYNAPIGGALFVAEIVLGTMAMEIFGPLVFSSVIATLTTQRFVGADPLYAASFELHNDWEVLPYLGLGLLIGLAAPWFLRLLRWSETIFVKIPLPLYTRMAIGGLIVGALTVFHPEVAGNGTARSRVFCRDSGFGQRSRSFLSASSWRQLRPLARGQWAAFSLPRS
jgi:chloride channel protein, CIC family